MNIPVLVDFDQKSQIGTLVFDDSQKEFINSIVQHTCISFGYTRNLDGTDIRIICASIIPDERYLGYLKQQDNTLYE